MPRRRKPNPAEPLASVDPRVWGQAVTALRGRRTQREVARRAGIDHTSWSFYERGMRVPRAKNYQRLLFGLRCTHQELTEQAWRLHYCQQADQRVAEYRRRYASTAARVRAQTGPAPAANPFRSELQEMLLRGALVVADALSAALVHR